MKVTLLNISAATGLLALAISCGKSEKSSVTSYSADPFLSTSELAKGSRVKTKDKATVESEIKTSDDFYDDGVPAMARMTTEDCISKKLNDLTAKSYGSYVGVGAEVDITDCAQAILGSDLTAAPSKMRVALQIGCNNQDFSSYDGKTFGEISASDTTSCATSTTVSELRNIRVQLAATTTSSGHKVTFENMIYMGKATASAQPCTGAVEGDVLKEADGCLDTNRSYMSIFKIDGNADSQEGTEDFTQLETSGIVSANGDNVWYQSGKMKVTMNNWTGDVTYTGTSTAPTYSLASGTETATGSLGSARSASKKDLVREIAGSIVQKMENTTVSLKNAKRAL